MACGETTVVPANGGSSAFAVAGENTIVVDSSSMAQCVEQIVSLVCDPALRERLQIRGISDAAAYFPERAASRFLAALFD
jgi:glycosyltransferase involved in cell wall biosynthesis